MHLHLSPDDVDERWRERFWSKVDVRGPDECWEWTRCRQVKGYGRVRWSDGKIRNSSRVVYAVTWGDPGELLVCHHCDNPPCCNPAHLFLGTIADNATDMTRKGRGNIGVRNANAKLNDDTVRAIRRASDAGLKILTIANTFGVSRDTVELVVRRQTWAHVSQIEVLA